MNTLLVKIADHNNLYWAWEKAKTLYSPGDTWFNELEVASFEANLSNELSSIHQDIIKGQYKLKPILPIAYPKSRDELGSRTRQTFWVNVRDQVIWLAVVNVIGRFLDSKMPFWSYGNRLYISMFYEEDKASNSSELKFGYYRATTKNLFRKWSQSWPLYRRHINLTAKLLSNDKEDISNSLENQDQQIIDSNEKLRNHPLKSQYLNIKYWSEGNKDGLFWAGLDLEKFYPKLNSDLIKKNLKIFLPDIYHSDELFLLFDSILNFTTDLNGWNSQELEFVGLSSSEYYSNLPTGLFVAGFLANVAMLAIDEEIQQKLNSNRNVAHFRYVDDHLILASNFDELLNWIIEYKDILDKSGLGTSFNTSKTIPNALAKYFEELDTNSYAGENTKSNAQKETSLDPNFPSPLMTQTLGKVSKIAGTSFNLLSADEEKSLIADIEHLLLTEFPDHELRKDTRVSFAARMLTTLVPQVSRDSSAAYRLHKNLCLKRIAIEDTKKIIHKTSSTNAPEVLEKLNQQLNQFELEEKGYFTKLSIENRKLENEERHLSLRTIKLLLKAIQDNHDKVRLWSRIMEFFLKSGVGKPKVIFDEIDKLIVRGETNDLSLTFIHSLILQVFSNLLLDTIKILSNFNSSQKKKKRAINFAKNLIERDVLNYFEKVISEKSKYYEVISFQIFKFACGTIIHILNEDFLGEGKIDDKLIDEFNLIDYIKIPTSFCEHTNYSFGQWSWWLYSKLPEPRNGKIPFLWNHINSHLNYAEQIDLNIALLYPKHISISILKKLDDEHCESKIPEGVLFEIYNNFSIETAGEFTFLNKVAKKIKPLVNHITLYEWIEWMRKKQYYPCSENGESVIFDPRLGEWAALEMIRQIAYDIKSRREDFNILELNKRVNYANYIHPHNFKISKTWIEENGIISWERLTQMFKIKKIELRALDDLIFEERFTPAFGMDQNNENQSLLQAMGNLLIMLLCKDSQLPSKWNPIGLKQAKLSLAKYKLKDSTISTYTSDIISACFSKRNLETQFNKGFDVFDFDFADDTNYDPPIFINLDDFISYVELALNKLKQKQLSVSSHQPRQLTPIRIMQLKRTDYQNLQDELEIE